MKKGTIIIIAIIAVMGILVGSVAGSYNALVEKRETVEASLSQIENQLQRRADLIPNFVETVKGYSDYEKSTLTAVTEARNALKNSSTPANQAEALEKLDGAISVWVNAVTEAYPELKANEQFIALQDELAGTENRIATARKDYNDAAREYNTKVKKFPTNIIANIFGFDVFDYFEASKDAQNVPEVKF